MIITASMISLLSPLKYMLKRIVDFRYIDFIYSSVVLLLTLSYIYINDGQDYNLLLFLSFLCLCSVNLNKKFQLEAVILPFVLIDIPIEFKSLFLLFYFFFSKNRNILNFISIILIINNSLFSSFLQTELNLFFLLILFFNNMVFDTENNLDAKKLIFTYVITGIFHSIQTVEFLILCILTILSCASYSKSKFLQKRDLALYVLPLSLYFLDEGKNQLFLALILLSYNYQIDLIKKYERFIEIICLFCSSLVGFYIFVNFINNYIYGLLLILYLYLFMGSVISELKGTNKNTYKVIILVLVFLWGGLWK